MGKLPFEPEVGLQAPKEIEGQEHDNEEVLDEMTLPFLSEFAVFSI